jgi:hypothetical protein
VLRLRAEDRAPSQMVDRLTATMARRVTRAPGQFTSKFGNKNFYKVLLLPPIARRRQRQPCVLAVHWVHRFARLSPHATVVVGSRRAGVLDRRQEPARCVYLLSEEAPGSAPGGAPFDLFTLWPRVLTLAGRFVLNKEKLQEVLFSVPNLEGFPVRPLAAAEQPLERSWGPPLIGFAQLTPYVQGDMVKFVPTETQLVSVHHFVCSRLAVSVPPPFSLCR